MARFVAFAFARAEIDEWHERHPAHEFDFVAHEAFDSDTIVLHRGREQPVREALLRRHAESPFTGVLNTKEAFVPLANEIAHDLGLPETLVDARVARDKWLMHQALECAGPRPRCRPLDPAAPPQDLAYPCVVKPRFGFDSLCTFKAESAGELARSLPHQIALLNRMPYRALVTREWLVEEFVGGTEHSVESLVWNGEIRIQLVSDKWAMHPLHLVETGEVMPSQLAPERRAAVARAASRALEALGIRHGWCHTEVKLDRGKAVVIESAARMGGGYFDSLVHGAYGLDRIAAWIELHLDPNASFTPTPRGVAIARRLQLDRSAWVLALHPPAPEIRPAGFEITHSRELGRFGRLVLAPPADYRHTLMEWRVVAESFDQARLHASLVQNAIEVPHIEIPDGIARLLARWS